MADQCPLSCASLENTFWRGACCECLESAGEIFWHLADHFYDGKCVPDHPLAPHLARIVSNLEACALAQAIVYLLTVEFVAWISRFFQARIATEDAKAVYDEEVFGYIRWLVDEASKLAPGQDFNGADYQSLGKASEVLELLSLPADISLNDIVAMAQPRALDRQVPFMEVLLFAAVGDTFWREIFLPAILVPGISFWRAPMITGAADPRSLAILQQVPEDMAHLQESGLQVVLHIVLDELQRLKREGVLQAFWAESSTLIALLRYGALFGHFRDGARDCVDDDLDFAVWPGSQTSEDGDIRSEIWGTWPHFVREVAIALRSHGASCYLTGSWGYAVADSGIDEDFFSQLFCEVAVGQLTLPVSFRLDSSAELPPLARCSAYGRSTPCPRDHVAWLAKYKGCAALPNLEYATLTTGDSCIAWMEEGLASERVGELRGTAMRLSDEGFASMEDVWDTTACEDAREASQRGEIVSVGKLPAQKERLKASRAGP